jgi:hypothetical protein
MTRTRKRKPPRKKVVQKKLERGAVKERGKVAAAQANLRLLDLPAFKQLAEQVHELTNGHNNMARAVSQNAQAFGDAFAMVDMHLHVIQKVMDDFIKGELDKVEANGDGRPAGVNWVAYKKFYWQCQEFEQFCGWLGKFLEDKPEEPEKVPDAEDDADVVFGG